MHIQSYSVDQSVGQLRLPYLSAVRVLLLLGQEPGGLIRRARAHYRVGFAPNFAATAAIR